MTGIVFDFRNVNWTFDPEMNYLFLCTKQHLFNDKLRHDGYLTLEHVYRALGLPFEDFDEVTKRKAKITGWTFYEDQEEAERNGAANYVDLGIPFWKSRDGVIFSDPIIVLVLNTDTQPINISKFERR